MSDRVVGGGTNKGGKRRPSRFDKNRVFALLRARIAEELKADGLDVKHVSQLELAIGTFVPSEIVAGFKISDYPFIGSRYVSLRDGHVYIVAGATDDGSQIMAYRLGFLHSVVSLRGGIAVGITPDAWMDSIMILYSLDHAHLEMVDGAVESVDEEKVVRRTYPQKKWQVYRQFLKKTFFLRVATPV